MITAQQLTKRYGDKVAVDGITFSARPGQVTGFLGPNGAGKSTTMRMIVGLDRPNAGSVTVNGKPFAEHRAPLREVGSLLDAKAVHTGRTAFDHLRAMAATHNIPVARVHQVIEMTGLESVAKKRVGGFSLGMGQRLGIASALLGDPATVILDEPVNGLDPEGVLWVRRLMRSLAAEGRTVFLSSHLMSEMAQTADHIVVLGRGRIIADAPVSEVLAGGAATRVRVRTPQTGELIGLLAGSTVQISQVEADVLEFTGIDSPTIAEAALANRILLHELTPLTASLEEAYMALTNDSVEYRTEAAR
ncbi:ABC transporter ATP-binding protein [Agromyces atrinae]|uniref:ABC transporter ATP-binding protein n=1 Tax=Agromyces atrinae TaxID=592376 RepID=A0A4Q2M9R5_9MICO|nr:ABC transporter ATP-binding protein [Agromyces atrinae]MCI2958289.1 ABC transporter ATP-binding protein [Agromyces atrinae]NYD66496.1 ABC-2 type transport system ATP-binding protein [Agromyces atrinae]RXZ87173.1 ABC transporter ATP-binding protein [Agromyces atrinae]